MGLTNNVPQIFVASVRQDGWIFEGLGEVFVGLEDVPVLGDYFPQGGV